jgi:hypothetical protein
MHTRQRTASLKHRLVSELICCTSTSSTNEYGEAQTRQWTSSVMHRLVKKLICWSTDLSANRLAKVETLYRIESLKNILVSKLICWGKDYSANWFAATQTRQRTDSLQRKLVSDLIRWARLVSELSRWSTALSAIWIAITDVCQRNWWHRLINELLRCTSTSLANGFREAQTRQRTDSLKHRLVSQLMCWSTDLLGNWLAKHRLVSELIRCTANTSVNGFGEA